MDLVQYTKAGGTRNLIAKYARTILGILLLSGVVAGGHLLPGLDNSEIENGIRDALLRCFQG